MRVICDTSTLSALAQMDELMLLERCFGEISLPETIISETNVFFQTDKLRSFPQPSANR